MSDDRWRDNYDDWKLRPPYDDEPDMSDNMTERAAAEARDTALALAKTIIRRLPENGEHWSLIQRFWAAVSEAAAGDEGAEQGNV